jgi:glycosyltransferase involved in cell wall biosynthesis
MTLLVPSPRRKLRVCQFTPCLWSGGAEERIARVLAAMDRDEFEIAWLGFGPVREALIERAGTDIRVVPLSRNPSTGVEPSLIPRIARVLWQLQPDIMHIHNWSTSAYGIAAARLAGVPHVLYESAGRESPEGPNAKRRALMHALAPHVTCFTTVCDFLAEEMQAHWGVPSNLVLVMPTGVDLDRIATLARDRKTARAKLGIPEDAIVVGSLSVLRPVKRIQDLVDAVALLAANRPKLRLLVAGNPLHMTADELRERAEAQGLGGRFHLPGRIEDPASILGAFDIFVNCSVFEGASNAIIEAMAASLPVVATRVGGTPELVDHGVNGLLVEPKDVNGLARALESLIDDPQLRARLGANGRKRAERRHSDTMMVGAYLNLYRELARSAPRAIGWRALRSVRRGLRLIAASG